MVKFRYSSNLTTHKKYLNYYMGQECKKDVPENQKPELFGNVTKEEYLQQMMQEETYAWKNGRKKKTVKSTHYKWILSPEKNLSEAVLKQYTKCFVTRLEQQTECKLIWQAAIHTDTAHPHVHLLINGKDKNGKEFRFSKDLIKNYAREMSSDILTHMCGSRDRSLIEASKTRKYSARRWTSIDQDIITYMNKMDDEMYCGNLPNTTGDVGKRLEHLAESNYADFKNGRYYLKRNYESDLKAVGRYNMFCDAKNHIKNKDSLKVYDSSMGEISGTVKWIYNMNDEDIWNNGLVVENKEGNGFYVPLFNPASTKLVGKKIKLATKENERGLLEPSIKFENEVEL